MEGSHMLNCSCCSCMLAMKSSIQKIIEIFVKEGPSSYCFKSVVHIILCYIRLSINFLINKEVDFISQHLLTSFRITRFYIYFCKQQGFESNKLNVTTAPCLIQVPCPRTHGCASLIFMEPEGGEKARNDTGLFNPMVETKWTFAQISLARANPMVDSTNNNAKLQFCQGIEIKEAVGE